MKPEPVHSPFDTTSPERYQASRRVALLSMSTNAVLVVGQIVVGILGHSQALVADGLHTLSDMAADILVLFALKHGAKAADEDHPYGHARIETAVTVALGSILVLVGVFIAVRAVLRLMDGEAYVPPSSITLWVAGATILA
jgi:cation diffusion facilitator family transporter